MTESPILEMKQVSKRYGATTALEKVTFSCVPSEIHAVLGENGAGKSTLMKLMAGVIRPSEGDIIVDGAPVTFASPSDAARLGIICIFQELSLVPDLNVRANLLMSAPGSGLFRLDTSILAQAQQLLERVGCGHIRMNARVGDLSLADQQVVEIVKGLVKKPRLLILDESTSALNTTVVERVFELVRAERDLGVSVLFISHRFHEIEALADRISVFRNGRLVDTFDNGAHTYSEIIDKMVGQPIDDLFPPKPDITSRGDGEVVLQTDNLAISDALDGISLTLRKGQITGLGGLDGQGQTPILKALVGVLRGVEGTIAVAGEVTAIPSPAVAKNPGIGIAYIPEDRKTEGLIQSQSILENLELPGIGNPGKQPEGGDTFTPWLDRLELKHGGLELPVSSLSGGNQQKVVLSKWLALAPRVLLLADPTRGIDVKTKTQIYQMLRQLADEGTAILLLTTDYEELIHLCDTAHIVYGGRVVAELTGEDITGQNIIAASMNVGVAEAGHA
ncbi:MAG: sugar ABC transporter ATP-binding protein [Cohaesibacteraceae bacterium]